jgi:pyruvate kinase
MRRPSTPVLAFTQDVTTARRLQLAWGVRPFLMEADVKHHDEVVGLVDRCLLAAKLAQPGDCIAILMGDPIQERPPTNLLRLHRVRGPS